MCAAIDMLASEQLYYGRSPPAGFLTDYTTPIRRPTKLTSRGFSAPSLAAALKPVQFTLRQAPRSCIKTETEKKKKRVVFADDRGYALEHVKVMTEPSHVPPIWALKIVASPPTERKLPQPAVDIWETRFVQPASDYVEFRRRITEDCVSLENVIVKHGEGALDGTVKVKNMDFLKEVFIRASSDGWSTSEDTYCAFVESGPQGSNGQSLYDTFGFRLPLPIHSRKLEFCVCFKCKGQEFWDNNRGINYTIEKSSVRNAPAISCARIKSGNSWTSRADPNGNSNGSTPYW